jgi:hypothetical protein
LQPDPHGLAGAGTVGGVGHQFSPHLLSGDH